MIVERLRRSQPRETTNDTEKTDAQEIRSQYNLGGRDDLAMAGDAREEFDGRVAETRYRGAGSPGSLSRRIYGDDPWTQPNRARIGSAGFCALGPPRAFSGSARDSESRAHAHILIYSPLCPKPWRLKCGAEGI